MRTPRQWYRIQALADGLTAEINVYDEIGPSFCGEPTVSAKSFGDELDALPASVKTIRVHINSPGGDVFDALTIANRLRAQRQEKGRTVEGIVEGVAASAATLITSACNPLRMSDNALLMVHNPTVGGRGNAAQMRKMAELLDRTRSSIIATYQWNSPKTTDELGALLDDETWMDAALAVQHGFAHEVVSGVSVTASLRESSVARLGNIPEALRSRVEALIAQPVTPEEPLPEEPASQEITREQLEAEHSDLVNALLEEGREEQRIIQAALPIARADLDARASGLVAEIRSEGLAQGRTEAIEQQVAEGLARVRGEVATQAAATERSRIQAIESMATRGHRTLTFEAKFGAEGKEPMSPEAYAMAVLQADRTAQAKHLTDAQADAEDAFVLGGAAPQNHGASEEAQRKHLISVGAKAASVR